MYISDFICCGTGVQDFYSRSKAKILKKLEIVEKQIKVEEGKESRKIRNKCQNMATIRNIQQDCFKNGVFR